MSWALRLRRMYNRCIHLSEKEQWILILGGSLTFLGACKAYDHYHKFYADASEFVVHPSHNHWTHSGFIDSFDMASVRRGYEVYKQVCAACHSMKYIRYRHFIDNFMSEEEVKAEAKEALINDINDKGEPIQRPGLPNDFLPSPYPNKKAAAAANNGAAPPDLSMIVGAREGAEDYVFSLLTGYGFDTPEGVLVEEGKAYNPYFPNGSVLAMPQQLFDEGIEYKDGTTATMTQQAKDVATFLYWAGEQWHDTRKRWIIQIFAVTPIFFFALYWAKRHVFTHVKHEKFLHRTTKGRQWTPDSSQPPPPKDAPPVKKLN